jgi:hypothetical protein
VERWHLGGGIGEMTPYTVAGCRDSIVSRSQKLGLVSQLAKQGIIFGDRNMVEEYDSNRDSNKIEIRRELIIAGAQAHESTGVLTKAEAASIVEKANAATTLADIEAVSAEYNVLVIERSKREL